MSDPLLIIVPARGGSKRLKRKNILPYSGRPLFVHAATHAHLPSGRVVVTTDSEEIASIASVHGLEVHMRDFVPDDQTIPEASKLVADDLDWTGAVLTVQPTVVPVPPLTELLQSDLPAILSIPAQHDHWDAQVTGYTPRNALTQLVGIYYWPAGSVGEMPVTHVVVDYPTLDIDTPADYAAATSEPDYYIGVVSAAPTTWNGGGHDRRQSELALLLQRQKGWWWIMDTFSDLLILDIGDTTVEQIAQHRTDQWNSKIVTFEDRGRGALHADATINSLVANPYSPTHEYQGGDYAFIRSEFLGLTYREHPVSTRQVLLAFGSTDAKDLGHWAKDAVRRYGYKPTFPYDYPTMVEAMMSCDLMISGAGQIVHEAAYLGVPTIVVAATLRESIHTHLGAEHGNLFLGFAGTVTTADLIQAIAAVVNDPPLRQEMREKGRRSVDGKGADRILHILEGLMI